MNNIAQFIFELGHLKLISHEGWKLAGIKHPESVADHSLRTAQIGYLLAHLEDYPHPEQVCTMCVFHDIGETRIGDIHKLAARYIQPDETQVIHDQVAPFPQTIKEKIIHLWEQTKTKHDKAGILAKDADLLEMAYTAREYATHGYTIANEWIEKISHQLVTPSAKQLLHTMKNMDPYQWWKELKK